jgi:hypothetical protein
VRLASRIPLCRKCLRQASHNLRLRSGDEIEARDLQQGAIRTRRRIKDVVQASVYRVALIAIVQTRIVRRDVLAAWDRVAYSDLSGPLGQPVLLGAMPDWTPAAMLGGATSPRPRIRPHASRRCGDSNDGVRATGTWSRCSVNGLLEAASLMLTGRIEGQRRMG